MLVTKTTTFVSNDVFHNVKKYISGPNNNKNKLTVLTNCSL